jgi:Peptidase family M28
MELKNILAVQRPTFDPTSWLPEVMEWMPADAEEWVDEREDTVALVHEIPGGSVPTLFACHLDTVHARAGYQKVRSLRGRSGALYSPDGDCLGADDGAGIWLMLEMIAAEVPGTYVFHVGEEKGCLGSRWLATHRRDWLSGFKRAIGFDRPGTSDVITHFGGVRGCSPAFAMDLAWQLSSHLPQHELTPCRTGGLTDVRHYIGIIPNCTNISVGYHQQHRREEWVDVHYLQALRWAVIEVFSQEAFIFLESMA